MRDKCANWLISMQEDKALDLPAAASSANQNEEIDFEPEAQQDAFRLISEMKPIEPAQDAQSDTALSIGPRSDSTILRGTPPDGPDDLVLSTLEQELGLKRKGSGAESIASMTPQVCILPSLASEEHCQGLQVNGQCITGPFPLDALGRIYTHAGCKGIYEPG